MKFWLSNCKIFELIFRNFENANFSNWRFLEFSKLQSFRIFHISNFRKFPYWKFLEFSKLPIFGILQIERFLNFRNWKFLEFTKIANFWKFSKSQIFFIFQIGIFWNFEIRNVSHSKILLFETFILSRTLPNIYFIYSINFIHSSSLRFIADVLIYAKNNKTIIFLFYECINFCQ